MYLKFGILKGLDFGLVCITYICRFGVFVPFLAKHEVQSLDFLEGFSKVFKFQFHLMI